MYLPGDYNIVTFKMMQRWILELFIYKTYLSIEHADCTKKKSRHGLSFHAFFIQ